MQIKIPAYEVFNIYKRFNTSCRETWIEQEKNGTANLHDWIEIHKSAGYFNRLNNMAEYVIDTPYPFVLISENDYNKIGDYL